MEHDVMDATFENDARVEFMTLGAAGQGSIEAGENQQERLEEFTERVGSGEFHRETTGTIPCTCIDGRPCANNKELMPNGPGGSEVMMVADDLTTKDFALDGDTTTAGQYRNTLAFLAEAGYPVGAHIDCGANKKLPAVYAYIRDNATALRDIAQSLGYEISDSDHELIVGSAAARADFSDGDEILDVARNQGGRIDELEGEHKEVIAVINRRSGTTLDRDAVKVEFGEGYEAFNVDEWSFAEAARVISHMGGEDEVRQKRTAMLYNTLAIAGLLCGPNMRVIVRN